MYDVFLLAIVFLQLFKTIASGTFANFVVQEDVRRFASTMLRENYGHIELKVGNTRISLFVQMLVRVKLIAEVSEKAYLTILMRYAY